VDQIKHLPVKRMISILFIISCFFYCKPADSPKNVSVVAFRNNDTFFVRLDNHSSDTFFVSSGFWPSFRPGNDTIFLETFSKEKFGLSEYYRYSKLLPFSIFTPVKVEGISPDTIIQIHEQVSYFNQFKVGRFRCVPPGGYLVDSMTFFVPKNVDFVGVLFYSKDFFKQSGIDTMNYQVEDLTRFESIYSSFTFGRVHEYVREN
jgi:hypothetical protein